jgi:ankyrin repeat protein
MGLDGAFLRAILTPVSANSKDAEGRSVLHLASLAGNVQAVRDILGISDRADLRDNEGKNALDMAFSRPDSREHIEIAELLILSGAHSDNPIFPYFAPAARSANYNARRADGVTPLHFAAGEGYEGLISFLFEKRADVNIKNNSGATPLHEAARSGNIRVMQLILDQGAEVNAQDAKGNTALHVGIPAEVQREAISLFLSRGANPNLRDEHGESPLHIVVTLNSKPEVAQVLLGGGADVNIRNIDGKTPLYLGVQESREKLISLLLVYGSDIFAADNAGISPFDRAMAQRGNVLGALITPETVVQSDSAGNTMLHAMAPPR